jgi:transcriptional regulator with XRE-family HTH domain
MAKDFNNLAKWIPARMKEAGIETVEKLANRAGLSRTAIYRWFYDQDRPSEDSMLKICRVVGVSLEEGLSQYSPKKVGRPSTRDDSARKKARR